jgi:hypothetical protein
MNVINGFRAFHGELLHSSVDDIAPVRIQSTQKRLFHRIPIVIASQMMKEGKSFVFECDVYGRSITTRAGRMTFVVTRALAVLPTLAMNNASARCW